MKGQRSKKKKQKRGRNWAKWWATKAEKRRYKRWRKRRTLEIINQYFNDSKIKPMRKIALWIFFGFVLLCFAAIFYVGFIR